MAYTFSQDGEILCETLESFWLYLGFDLEESKDIVQVQDGYLALYFSQQPPVKGGTGPSLSRPKREHIGSCEIKSSADHTLTMSNLRLLRSRQAEFRNERSYLHLYRFEDHMKPDWFKSDWNKDYIITQNNDDQTEYMERTLDFESVKEREVYWLAIEESSEAIQSLTACMPFLGNNIFNDILQAHKQSMPQLTINSKWHGQSFEFPSSSDQVRNRNKRTQGWVMITEGAFSSLPLSADLDSTTEQKSWTLPGTTDGADIIQKLSQVIYDYPIENQHGGIKRYLFNSQESGGSAVIKTTKHPPYELFHIREINDDRMNTIISDKK